jgi:hypothetical protein
MMHGQQNIKVPRNFNFEDILIKLNHNKINLLIF